MNNEHIFMPDDKCYYVGSKHKQELAGKVGVIHFTVAGRPGVYITFWPDTKQKDSYVMNGEVLTAVQPKDFAERVIKKEDKVKVEQRRQKMWDKRTEEIED